MFGMNKDTRLSRRGLLRGAVVLSALGKVGCAVQGDDRRPLGMPADVQATSPQAATAKRELSCPDVPTALVLGGDGDAAALMQTFADIGFATAVLPLDQSPIDMQGLLVIPSFASELPGYAQYMEKYAIDLSSFVDNGNVLMQLRQKVEIEPELPFLPSGYGVSRQSAVVSGVQIQNLDNAVVSSLENDQGLLNWMEPEDGTPIFVGAESFEVLLADPADGHALLIETAYGQGRYLLSALALDRPAADGAQAPLALALLRNLLPYVKSVCTRTAGAVRIKPSRPSTAFSEGSQLLVALPDTQYYSLKYPGLFHAQTTWIRDNVGERNIKYVLHLGDIVNNNTEEEWKRASAAMGQLHGNVPYALAPGNHDYGKSGTAATRQTLMNDHFSFSTSANMPTFGGAYQMDRLDNSYHLFSIQGRNFVVIAIEWAPRDEVVEWADQVMSKYPDRQGILVTHAYLNNNNWRYDHTDKEHSQRWSPYNYKTPDSKNDGEQLWQKLVKRHRFMMTLNGHVLGDGCGYLASVTDQGNVCHQMLSNYQMRDQGGEGYMRLLEFLEDGTTVRVYTYSPLYDTFLDEPDHNFTLTLDV